MKTIELIISPDGETRLETKGFSGSACKDASKFLEQALGRKTSDQLTSEFHQHASQTQEEQQRLEQ